MTPPNDSTLTLPTASIQGAAGRDVAALPPGHTVFEYRIDKMLGGGGFGITYLAQDVNLQLPVAIKEYFPGDVAVRSTDLSVQVRSSASAEQYQTGLERFLDEARALASFRHPNIVRVLRYFRENGTAYIVMEYETGEPLKRWMARQTSLDQRGLLQIIYPLLDGLAAVHKVNFLHRDIKPDNIYVRADNTPVLLDFGAARRLTGNHDMTNIVSPGFAPLEQYHSRGNQGPWTDLYSLGAVMYWMTTGSKPLEAASRVRDDAMPKAAEAGNQLVFGEALLNAIDWALTPDETLRPQTVGAMRQALLNAEYVKTQSVRTDDHPDAAGTAPAAPAAATEAPRRNVLGTVMSVGLMTYAAHTVEQQVAAKSLLNELLTKAIHGVQEASRVLIDTAEGASICFLGDPEEALTSALLLRDLLAQKYGQKLAVQIGLHLGPIRMVSDINHHVNVVGDGINVAQRIMDFSKPNQIVVSRTFHDVISRITDNAANQFEHLGPHMDKHLRSHDVYAVLEAGATPAPVAARHTGFENTASFAALASLTPEVVADIEAELARAIGPLARVLVKKAVPRTVSAQGLRDLLAISIPDPTARTAFLQPRESSRVSHSASHPNSRSISGFFSRSGGDGNDNSRNAVSRPASMPVPGQSQGDRSDRSDISQTAGPHSTSIKVHNFSAAQQALLERALSHYIGPLARTLVRKEAARQPTFAALLQALAGHIDKADDKARFLATAQKLQNSP